MATPVYGIIVTDMEQQLTIACPAKINLSLRVLGLRDDGYHEIDSVMHSISLADRLFLRLLPEGIRVETEHPAVPAGEGNLVYKAAFLLQQRCSPPRGAEIRLEKRIPVAAGLAGGSSDAAGAIRGLNQLWQLGLTEAEMLDVAQQVGSDVPFCLLGGAARVQGRGELVSPVKSTGGWWAVLVCPRIAVSTAAVYRAWDLNPQQGPDTLCALLAALRSGRPEEIGKHLVNDLEPVTAGCYPVIYEIKERMLALGAAGAVMSGSGPAVVALAADEKQAQRIAGRLAEEYSSLAEVLAVQALGRND